MELWHNADRHIPGALAGVCIAQVHAAATGQARAGTGDLSTTRGCEVELWRALVKVASYPEARQVDIAKLHRALVGTQGLDHAVADAKHVCIPNRRSRVLNGPPNGVGRVGDVIGLEAGEDESNVATCIG